MCVEKFQHSFIIIYYIPVKIPIYKGCSGSILRPNSVCKEHFHGKDGFGDLKHSYEVNINRIEKTHAVNAMYEFACKVRFRTCLCFC